MDVNEDGFYSADEDEDVLSGQAPKERVPRGVGGEVIGVKLIRHPDRPLRVPVTQVRHRGREGGEMLIEMG